MSGTRPRNNLNIIHALRSYSSIYDMMAVGALYALGHDDLAGRAEDAFPALRNLDATLSDLNNALARDYPVMETLFFGDPAEADRIEARIPAEREAEIAKITAWRDQEYARVAQIRREIDAIIDDLYDVGTSTAEEGQSL